MSDTLYFLVGVTVVLGALIGIPVSGVPTYMIQKWNRRAWEADQLTKLRARLG